MKALFKCSLLIIIFGVSLSSFSQSPSVNNEIIKYVDTVIGERVGRGECWDLASQALEKSNAEWNGKFKYGKELDVRKDEILPGDIVQFRNVKLKKVKGNAVITEEMKKHTAIIYKVYKKGKYQLAHQNTSYTGKKVGLSNFDMKHVKRGKVKIYRPHK